MAVAARVGKYLQPHFSFGIVDVEAVLVVGADAGALSFAAAGITTVRLVCSHAGGARRISGWDPVVGRAGAGHTRVHHEVDCRCREACGPWWYESWV